MRARARAAAAPARGLLLAAEMTEKRSLAEVATVVLIWTVITVGIVLAFAVLLMR